MDQHREGCGGNPLHPLKHERSKTCHAESHSRSDAVVNLGALTLLLQGLRTGNGDLISDGCTIASTSPTDGA